MSGSDNADIKREPNYKQLVAAYESIQGANYDGAIQEFSKLIAQGSSLAALYLGSMHQFGQGFAKNDEVAIRYYRIAEERGSKDAVYRLANIMRDRNDTNEALELYKKGADLNDPASNFWAHRLLRRSDGKPGMSEESLRYLIRASDLGHVYAMRAHGIHLIRQGGIVCRMRGLLLVAKGAIMNAVHAYRGGVDRRAL